MKNKPSIIIISLLLILSAIKYFRFLPRSPFEADQEYLAVSADSILKGKLTLIGAPTSVGGMFIGPLYNYLIAIFMWVFHGNPLVINGLSSVWAVATIVLIYLVGKKLFGYRAGLFSALLALFSYKFLYIADNPPLVFPLPLVTLITLFLSTQKKSFTRSVALGLLVGLALNLHFSGVYLLPLLFTEGIAGILSIILPLAPLLLFEFRHDWFITKNAIQFITHPGGEPTGIWSRLYSFMSSQAQMFQSGQLTPVLIAVVALSFVWMIKQKHKLNRWFVGSYILPLIFFMIYSGQLLPYYAAIAWSPFLLIVGDFLSTAWGKSNLLKYGIIIFFVFFSLSQIRDWNQFSVGRGLDKKLAALRYIKSKAGNNKYYFSKTLEPAADNGFTYLTQYVGINSSGSPLDTTYTIVAPFNWQGIQPDIRFGDFGVVLPRPENNE